MSTPLRIGLVGNGDAASDRLTRLLAEQGIHIVYALQPDAIDAEHIAARDIDVWLFDIDDASWSDAIDALMDGSPVPVFFNEHAAINRQPHVEYWCRNLITRMQELVSEPDLMPPSRAVGAGGDLRGETRGETLHIAFPRSVETVLAKEPPSQLDPALLEEIEELEALLHIDARHTAPADDWLFNSAAESAAPAADADAPDALIAVRDSTPEIQEPVALPAALTDDSVVTGPERIVHAEAADFATQEILVDLPQAERDMRLGVDPGVETVPAENVLQVDETNFVAELPLVAVAEIAPPVFAQQTNESVAEADIPLAWCDAEHPADITPQGETIQHDLSADLGDVPFSTDSGFAERFEVEQFGEFETPPLAAVPVAEFSPPDAAHIDAGHIAAPVVGTLADGDSDVQPDYSAELAPPLLESVAASGAFEQLAGAESAGPAAGDVQEMAPALPCDLWILGASLGGPAALKRFFAALTEPVPVCFLLAQHIDAHFLPVLGKILEQSNSFYRVAVLSRPGLIEAGALLLAPTEKRLRFIEAGQIVLSQKTWTPPYSPCIDDVMLDAVEAYGRQVNAIVFSGMGEDGVHGARAIRVAGGEVWTQEAESCASAVMPDAVFDAGYACRRAAPEILAEQLMARYHDAGTQRSQRS